MPLHWTDHKAKGNNTNKALKGSLIALGGLAALAGVGVVIGITNTFQIIEVTRTTTATKEQLWKQFADVPNRTKWDDSLEYAQLDGNFETGSTGTAKLKDYGGATRFVITEVTPLHSNSERFYLPLFNEMYWHHNITETADGKIDVTFKVEVTGPSALILQPILADILKKELPPTVDKLVNVAEQSDLE